MRADRRGSNGCRELKCPLRETIFSVCGVHLNVTELLETAVTGGAVTGCLGAGGQVSVSDSFGFFNHARHVDGRCFSPCCSECAKCSCSLSRVIQSDFPRHIPPRLHGRVGAVFPAVHLTVRVVSARQSVSQTGNSISELAVNLNSSPLGCRYYEPVYVFTRIFGPLVPLKTSPACPHRVSGLRVPAGLRPGLLYNPDSTQSTVHERNGPNMSPYRHHEASNRPC